MTQIKRLLDKYRPLFLGLLLFCFYCPSYGQTYNPSSCCTVSNKAYGAAQSVTTDGRSWFYDATNFVMRDYNGTTEVLSYLNLAKYRSGHFPIYVHTGGILQTNGIWIGGATLIYWFKDSTGSANLVRWYTDSTGVPGGPFFAVANNLSEGNAGLIKGNLALDMVDNTSDAQKNAASVSLTNHTIDANNNTFLHIPNAALTNSAIGMVLNNTGATPQVTTTPAALGSSLVISIPYANGSDSGFLRGTDWVLFNNKVDSSTISNDTLYNWVNGTRFFQSVISGTGGVNSVSGTNTSLLFSPTTGNVLGQVNPAFSFNWSGQHSFLSFAPIISTLTTNGGVFYGDGSGQLLQTGAGTSGQIFQSNGGGAPTFFTPNAGTIDGWLGYTPLSNALGSTHIFVGNGSNVATDVAVSGDIALNNAGLSTIQPNVVSYSKIQAAASAGLMGATAGGNFGLITLGSNLSFSGSVLNANFSSPGLQTVLATNRTLISSDSIKANIHTFRINGVDSTIQKPTGFITFVGDSWTAGTGALDTFRRYSNLVTNALQLSQFNSGVPGGTLASVYTSRAGLPVKDPTRAFLVFELGLNDIIIGTATVDSISIYYRGILATCFANGWPVKNLCILSIGYGIGINQTTTIAFNAAIKHICDSTGVFYADDYTALITTGKDLNMVTGDYHPNDWGHQIVANAVLNTLKWSLNTDTTKTLQVTDNSEFQKVKINPYVSRNPDSSQVLAADRFGNLGVLGSFPDSTRFNGSIVVNGNIYNQTALLPNAFTVGDVIVPAGAGIVSASAVNTFKGRFDPFEASGATTIRNYFNAGNISLVVSGGTTGNQLVAMTVNANGDISVPNSEKFFAGSGVNIGSLVLLNGSGNTELSNAFPTGNLNFNVSGGTSGGVQRSLSIFPSGSVNVQKGGTFTEQPLSVLTASSTTNGSLPFPQMNQGQRTAIAVSPLSTASITNAGTGYTTGAYGNVPLVGGSGSGGGANITITGGIVQSVSIATGGLGYHLGDVLTVNAANVGGTGSGAQFTVTAITQDGLMIYNTSSHKPNYFDASRGAWQAVADSGDLVLGVSRISPIDSLAKSANGLQISGVNLIAQSADASFPGMVTTGAQTLAGAKTFTGSAAFTAATAAKAVFSGNLTTPPAAGHGAAIDGQSFSVSNQTTGSLLSPYIFQAITYTNTSPVTYSTSVTGLYVPTPIAGTNTTFTPANTSAILAAGDIQMVHPISTTATTFTAGAGAGSSPTITIAGSDIAGVITVTTGTAPTGSNATVVTVNYNTAYNTNSFPTLTPANALTAALNGIGMVFTTGTTSNFTISCGTTALAAATTYKWYYHVGGN